MDGFFVNAGGTNRLREVELLGGKLPSGSRETSHGFCSPAGKTSPTIETVPGGKSAGSVITSVTGKSPEGCCSSCGKAVAFHDSHVVLFPAPVDTAFSVTSVALLLPLRIRYVTVAAVPAAALAVETSNRRSRGGIVPNRTSASMSAVMRLNNSRFFDTCDWSSPPGLPFISE